MNNKGFNWFFPIAIFAMILIFMPGLWGTGSSESVTESPGIKIRIIAKIAMWLPNLVFGPLAVILYFRRANQ